MSHEERQIFQFLTEGEEFDLQECEAAIEASLEQFWQVVFSITKIQQLRLWRKHYRSFADYCEQRWGLTATRIRQMARAYDLKMSLKPELGKLITNEWTARELDHVPEEYRNGVVQEAAKNGPVNSGTIREAAKQRVPKEIFYDELGEIIPDDAVPFWKRKQEVQDMLTMIVKIKSAITEAIEKEDALYYRITNSTIMELNALYGRISDAKPYAVCTTCMGVPSMQVHGCGTCGNRGLISKFQWDTQSPKEVKEIRLKAIAERNQES